MIQIRNVPDPLHRELNARAARAGKTLEVAQVLRRHARRGVLGASRGEGALGDFQDLRIERYPHHLCLGRIWALRENATAYDAAYLALAKRSMRRC